MLIASQLLCLRLPRHLCNPVPYCMICSPCFNVVLVSTSPLFHCSTLQNVKRLTQSCLCKIVYLKLPTFPPLCWQVCGGFPDALARTAQLIDENISVDFVDVNMGERGSHHRGSLSVIQLTHLASRHLHLSLLRTNGARLSHLYCVRPQRRQRTAAVPPAPLYINFPQPPPNHLQAAPSTSCATAAPAAHCCVALRRWRRSRGP